MNYSRETDRLHQEFESSPLWNPEDLPAFNEVELTEEALSSEELGWDDLQPLIADETDVVWIGDTFACKPKTHLSYKVTRYFLPPFFMFGARFRGSVLYDMEVIVYSMVFEDGGRGSNFAAEYLVRFFARDARVAELMIGGDEFQETLLPISDALLEHMIQMNLPRVLYFDNLTFSGRTSVLLARLPNEHVTLSFRMCSFEDNGAALADAINDNEGIHKITFYDLNNMSPENVHRIFNGLRRNTRVDELCLQYRFLEDMDEAQTRAIFAPLAENRGLELLAISFYDAADKFPLLCSVLPENHWLKKLTLLDAVYLEAEQWSLLHSIQNHPSIETLNVAADTPPWDRFLSDVQSFARGRALSDLLKTNTLIRRIVLENNAYESEIYQNEIWPRLAMNCFRPLLAAIKQVRDQTLRAKLFRWAHGIIQSNPKFASCRFALLQRLVSDNPDLVMKHYVRKGDREQSEKARSKPKRK